MTGINRMTGTPWHVERIGRQEGDPRRHRSRCEYYNHKRKFCSRKNGSCIGSAHCLEYSEKATADSTIQSSIGDSSIKMSEDIRTKGTSLNKIKDNKSDEVKEMNDLRKIGTLVWHKKYEVGEVIAVDIKNVSIRFDSGKEIKFDINTCIESGMLRVL